MLFELLTYAQIEGTNEDFEINGFDGEVHIKYTLDNVRELKKVRKDFEESPYTYGIFADGLTLNVFFQLENNVDSKCRYETKIVPKIMDLFKHIIKPSDEQPKVIKMVKVVYDKLTYLNMACRNISDAMVADDKVINPNKSLIQSLMIVKKSGVVISNRGFILYLESVGYRSYFISTDHVIYVRITNGRAEVVHKDQIISDVTERFKKLGSEILMTNYSENIHKLFSDKLLKTMEILPNIGTYRRKDYSHLFFNNVVVEITPEGSTIIDYDDFPHVIWRKDVIKHNYNVSNVMPPNSFKFRGTLNDISESKYQCVLALGFALSDYRKEKDNKTLLFTGRNGKEYLMYILGLVRNVCAIDFHKNNALMLERVELSHKLVTFSNVDSGFNFRLVSRFTREGCVVTKLSKRTIELSVKDSPKIIISTNVNVDRLPNDVSSSFYEIKFKSLPNREYLEAIQEFKDSPDSCYSFLIRCIQVYLVQGLY